MATVAIERTGRESPCGPANRSGLAVVLSRLSVTCSFLTLPHLRVDSTEE